VVQRCRPLNRYIFQNRGSRVYPVLIGMTPSDSAALETIRAGG